MSKFLGTKNYQQIRLSEDEISRGGFKRHLGGGEENWDLRGAFQLHFLRLMGLLPWHRLIDAGCGPIRAGAHFIRYLDHGSYFGLDYNADFIGAATRIVEADPALRAKEPRLRCVDDFDMAFVGQPVDYALAFSVLNHANPALVASFFRNLATVSHPATRTFVTHARWFDESHVRGTGFSVTNVVAGPKGISPDLKMSDWGWGGRCGVFPVVEFGLAAAG